MKKKVKNYSIEWKIKKKVKFCQKTLFFYYEYDTIKLPRRDTGVIKPTKWLIRESELVGGVEYLNLFKDPKAYYGMPTCTYV